MVSLMPPLDLSLISLVAYLAVGGVLLALAQLAVEYRAPRRAAAWRFASVCVLALGGGTAFAWGGGAELTLACLVLAAVAMLAAILRLEATRRLAARLLTPAPLWGTLLVVSIAAAAYAPFATGPVDADVPADLVVEYYMLESLAAVTDRGRELPLCAYKPSSSLKEQELAIIGIARYQHQLIRLAEPSSACNCHGWIYAGGQYAIRGRDIDTLLEDNDYQVVGEPQPNDLVIYRTSDHQVAHTALVRLVREDGAVFVESKWGPLGAYLHPVKDQPYGESFTYYRSRRAGHLVEVLPASSVPPEEGSLAGPLAAPVEQATWVINISSGCASAQAVPDRPVMRLPSRRTT